MNDIVIFDFVTAIIAEISQISSVLVVIWSPILLCYRPLTTNSNNTRFIPIITIAFTSVLVVVGEILKQDSKYNSYFADAVKRELGDIKLEKMMVLSVMIMVMNKLHDVAVVGDGDDLGEERGLTY